MNELDKYRGCLIGGAVGDALGYPVEFMTLEDIRKKYGRNGITEYDVRNGVAEISDDTQMTLFTATGILLGKTRSCLRGISGDASVYIWYNYRDWYRTQTEKYPLSGCHHSWLDGIPELFSRRAPGNTCLSVLKGDKSGTLDNPINNSKGCGGVMRVAPVGLYFGKREYLSDRDPLEAMEIGAETAALTHGHPLGYIPAAALSYLVALLSHNDMPLEEAIEEMTYKVYREYDAKDETEEYIDDFRSIIDKAYFMALDKSIDDENAIRSLGAGWVAEEAFAIALFCSLRYSDDFEKAVSAAVNHDGDSDSTGAITGNILGAYLGLSSIPGNFIDNLELKDIILEIADDLYHDCPLDSWNIAETPDEIKWENKYSHFDKYYQE